VHWCLAPRRKYITRVALQKAQHTYNDCMTTPLRDGWMDVDVIKNTTSQPVFDIVNGQLLSNTTLSRPLLTGQFNFNYLPNALFPCQRRTLQRPYPLSALPPVSSSCTSNNYRRLLQYSNYYHYHHYCSRPTPTASKPSPP